MPCADISPESKQQWCRLLYSIEKRSYGLGLSLGGIIGVEELSCWLDDLCRAVNEQPDGFCVYVDMRTLVPLETEGQILVHKAQRYAKHNGMARSVVILSSPVTTTQFKQIAMDTGIYEWERYIDASRHSNWQQLALDWVERAIDPDLKTATESEKRDGKQTPSPVGQS